MEHPPRMFTAICYTEKKTLWSVEDACIMYLCMFNTFSRVWINRAWLPILLVVSSTGKMFPPTSPFASENLVTRDGLGRLVPRQPAYFPYSGGIWCLLTGFFLQLSATASTCMYRHNRHWASHEFIGSRKFVPMAFPAEGPPAVLNVVPVTGALPFQVSPWTMTNLYALLFLHAHYWYTTV